MGEYAGSLFWVILYSMLLSWVLAVTVTPMLCHDYLKVNAKKNSKPGKISQNYKRVLELVLNNQKKSLLVVVGLFSIGVVTFGHVPPGFMPESQRPQFAIDIRLPQGTDIERTHSILQKIEKDVWEKSNITSTTSFIGSGGLRFMLTYSPEPANASYAQMLVDVDDYSVIETLIEELQVELNERYTDASISVWKFMLGPGGGKKIEVGFKGPDSEVLRQLSEQAKAIMEQSPAVVAVQDDWRQQVPVIRPVYSEEKLQTFGLTAVELNQAIQQTVSGRNVGVYREGNDLIPIVVRSPGSERHHERVIENTKVHSGTIGQFVQVGQLIDSSTVEWQDAMLRRIDRVPTIMHKPTPLLVF